MFNTETAFVRLWRNEATRVFADKLISDADRDLVTKVTINDLISSNFASI
jgi:dynein heavy chain